MNFKEWYFLKESEDNLWITPHDLEGYSAYGFLYCPDGEMYLGYYHDEACSKIPAEKRKQWGIVVCDDRSPAQKVCLAGRISRELPEQPEALSRLMWVRKAKEESAKSGKKVNPLHLQDEYIKKVKDFADREMPYSIDVPFNKDYAFRKKYSKYINGNVFDEKMYQRDALDFFHSFINPKGKNFMVDPETGENLLQKSSVYDEFKHLSGKTVISFWNSPGPDREGNDIYKNLLKPCLEKIIEMSKSNPDIEKVMSDDLENVYVSIPGKNVESLKNALSTAVVTPKINSAATEELEERQAIHTGFLRGKHLSTEERDTLREKYGMVVPHKNLSTADNYDRWKRQQGD